MPCSTGCYRKFLCQLNIFLTIHKKFLPMLFILSYDLCGVLLCQLGFGIKTIFC